MSALQVERKKGDVHHCANRCQTGNHGPSSATDRVSLLGYPLGWFCPKCVRDMQQAWQSALTNWETDEPVKPARHVLRSAA